MVELVHVSSRGQIVIPERVRKHLGLTQGTKLVLVEQGNSIILQKEEMLLRLLENSEQKEGAGWLALAEHSMKELWDNEEDEKTWKRYLDDPAT